MKVFLDVGANNGQSLAAAMKEDFDRIYCFEPASACWRHLKEIADERVKIKKYGLWNKDCKAQIFQPGSKGAGLWKKDKATLTNKETCEFVKASTWVAENISADDEVYMKINCEGAECDIMEDLLESGEIHKINYTLIYFDVRKIAAMKHREAELMEKLAAAGIHAPRVVASSDVVHGEPYAERMRLWLDYIARKSA